MKGKSLTPSKMKPSRINVVRGWATWIIRSIALVFLTFGAYLMLKRIAFALGTLNFNAAFQIWMDIGEGHSFYRGIGMVIVGLVLGYLSSRIARWIIALPPTGCPGCGYALDGDPGGARSEVRRCPECGLPVDESGPDAGPGAG